MRKLTVTVLLCLSTVAVCQAQDAQPSPRLLCLARSADATLDMQVLGVVLPLQLTTQQLQALAAVYKQYPRPEPDLAPAEQALKLLRQFRARMIAGTTTEIGPADQQALENAFTTAFGEFEPRHDAGTKVTTLSAEEKLVWALLTEAQKGRLWGIGVNSQAAAEKALQVIGELRGKDAAEWAGSRDKLAACLSAAAGPEGSAARGNSRQMFMDFLNRIRNMTDADFANKHKELVAAFLDLLPPGTNLIQLAGEFDPSSIHQMLQFALLGARSAGIVQEMLAARATRPE